MDAERSALLIRCSREEAETIRKAARREHRTVSGYVLRVVMDRMAYMNRMAQEALPPPSRPMQPNIRRRP
jgi:hypothetical protein